jgi:curved DNA-binding protein CbpA
MLELPKPLLAKPLYVALGVNEDATGDEIRAGYMRIVRVHHPDINGGVVSDIYRSASHAYAVLMDAQKRKIYDETGVDPDEGGLQKHALAMIAGIAFAVIAEGRGESNILEAIREAIRREISVAGVEIRRAENATLKGQLAAEAIERRWTGAPDAKRAILEMIIQNVEKDRKAKEPHERKTAIAEMALALIDSASYERPEIKYAVSPYADRSTGTVVSEYEWVKF